MLKLRKAVSKDAPLILSLIRELAEYEREPKAVTATEDDIRRDGFNANPKFRAVIAEWGVSPREWPSSSITILHGKENPEST